MTDRKRKFSEAPGFEEDNVNNKIAANQTIVKILIGLSSAGSLIGKGGITISNIKKTAQIFMMVSKTTELYPGTSDRVCMLTGNIQGIRKAIDMIHETLHSSGGCSIVDAKSIRFLITTETAGLIIGKKGVHIREMKENCGCSIQISQKSDDQIVNERIIQLDGEWENISKAINIVLEKNAIHPPIQSLNYNEVQPAQETSFMFQNNGFQQQSFDSQAFTDANQIQNQRNLYAQNTNFNSFTNGNASYNSRDTSQIGGQADPFSVLRMVLENRQMDRRDIQEILAAVAILKRHNVMNLISLPDDHSSSGNTDSNYLAHQTSARAAIQMSPRKFGKADLIQRLYQSRDQSDFFNIGQDLKNDYGEIPDSLKDYKSGKEFYIDEKIVGLVIGPKGKNLHEMMSITNTVINVSKRGVFAENSNNRIVTIDCTASNLREIEKSVCIKRAYYLISDLYDNLMSDHQNGRVRDANAPVQ